jgi:hypothetical protein
MVLNNKMYWRTFTSTSRNKKVAQDFGKFQYVITFNTNQSHPYFVVPKSLSTFNE